MSETTIRPAARQAPGDRDRLLAAACAYARRGWHVFPFNVANRKPHLEGWPDRATTDTRKLTRWWHRWSEAGIALVCGPASDALAVDVDMKDGKDGEASLARLHRELGELPATREQRTGGGGRHLLFRYPSARKLKNSTGELAPGIDVKVDRGFIILAPSLHRSGRRYVWMNCRPLAELPEPWIEALRPPSPPPRPLMLPRPTSGHERYAERRLHRALARVYGASERNVALNAAAFSLGPLIRAGQLDLGRVATELHAAARAVGLGEQETRATLRSGLTAGIERGGCEHG